MKNILLIILACSFSIVHAQTIKGTVTDATTKEALQGATLVWKNTQQGTVADAKGIYEIAYPAKTPAVLIVSYIGYVSDSIVFNNQTELHIKLRPSASLREVEITDTKDALAFSTIDPMNRQTLSTKELTKAACCNLSESFETNATVDVTYNDALSGTKQIKMLGLDGAYTQTLIEQNSGIRGLSTNYGFSHIPGTWVSSIDITKGVGSVVNGYESISGQINIELLKPEKADRLHVNLYAGDWGRYETNVHLGHKFNKEWSTLLLTHASTVINKNDFNNDGFIDVATGYQLGALNKWKYEKTGKIMASFGVAANIDNRKGGQITFNNRAENDAKQIYGVGIQTRHLEAFSKTAFGFVGRPYKSVNLSVNARNYEHDAFYGFKSYNGKEQTLNANLYYQTIINTSDHKIKMGASYLLDNFNETYSVNASDSNFKRTESVPGVFAEYNYEILNKLSLLLGARTDFHNLYGTFFNPRAHIKVNLSRASVLRFSAGRGMRVANVFVEQPFIMASNRRVIVEEAFKPEIAWNYGVSLTHKFKIAHKNAALVVDFYRTDFQNQIVTDLDQNTQEVHLYNLKGQSYSNSFQTEFNYEPIKHFEVRLAYKWQDVRTNYNGALLQKPLIAKDRVLFNVAYATHYEKWKFDATVKWFGQNRIPNTGSNPIGLQMDAYSKPYYTVNAQVTKKFKRFELYTGAENIFNFMQKQQIIDPANPFGNYFDASLIWGPVMGRVFYAGFRMTMK
jgi:outer membrane receptor for ferrienterochelin and colicins